MSSLTSYGRITFRNILCATNFSTISETALGYAAAIASNYDAKVFVTHVIGPELYMFGPPGALPKTLAKIEAEGEQRIKALMSALSVRGVPHVPLLRRGEIVEVLMEVIAEHKIDLLVVGTRGRQGLRKLLMGSVADEIMRRAACPVLSVGPRCAMTSGTLDLRRILYATDFSEESLRALPIALSLGQEFGARTVLAHVAPEPGDDFDIRWSIMKAVTEGLRSLVPEEAVWWSDQEYWVEFGPTGEGILRVAGDRSADLIVMGARGLGTTLRTSSRLGRTADLVVSRSTCPVLTVGTLRPVGTEEVGNATKQRAA